MSNRSSSKQHGHAQSNILRPKSKIRKKKNKANAKVIRGARLIKIASNYKKALSSSGLTIKEKLGVERNLKKIK